VPQGGHKAGLELKNKEMVIGGILAVPTAMILTIKT
jgi:hypothetical protein